jgi:MATE family multidrug resistance protein
MTSQLGQLLLGVVDSIMIARVGIAELGASAFVGSLFAFFLVFGFGVCACIAPLVARADGAQKSEECGEILRHGLVFTLLLGVALAVVIEVLAQYLSVFSQPPEILILSKEYFLIMGWSLIPALLFHALRQYSEALSRPMVPMLIVLASVAVNAGLNWLLIYGNAGFPQLGLNGAGWATFITRIFMFVGLVIYIFRSSHFLDYYPQRWLAAVRWGRILEMLRIGASSGFQTLFEVGAFVAGAVMMGWLGTEALAAHQVALSVVSMTFMVTLGISFAVGIRVGSAMGRGDLRAARRIGFGGISIGSFWMALCGIGIYLARHSLPFVYVQDERVARLATSFLVFGAIFQIFDGAQCVAIGALRGMTDIRIPTFITFFVYWVVSVPLVYLLAFRFNSGPEGIWLGLTIGLILASILLTSRFDVSTRGLSR